MMRMTSSNSFRNSGLTLLSSRTRGSSTTALLGGVDDSVMGPIGAPPLKGHQAPAS